MAGRTADREEIPAGMAAQGTRDMKRAALPPMARKLNAYIL